MTPGDVIRKLGPVVLAAFAACIAIGVATGRAIDNAVSSIGRN